jgi:hypothetical protein
MVEGSMTVAKKISVLDALSVVIAGLVLAIPILLARPCLPKRDGRHKAGHDEVRGFGSN